MSTGPLFCKDGALNRWGRFKGKTMTAGRHSDSTIHLGKTLRFLVIAITAALVLMSAGAGDALRGPKLTASDVRLAPTAIKELSYLPRDNSTSMWTNYSHDITDADFAAVAGLGANSVRVMVAPSQLGWPNVNPAGAAKIADLVATAAAHGLQVHFTLFDAWGAYNLTSASATWVTSLLTPYAADPRIDMIELQNEIDMSNSAAINWAKIVLPAIQAAAPNIPRTLSVSGSSMSDGVKAMLNTFAPDLLTVANVHLYGTIDEDDTVIATAIAYAAGRPVIIGEAGFATGPNTTSGMELMQAQSYYSIWQLGLKYGIPTFAPWSYSDLPPDLGSTAHAAYPYWGVKRMDGTWKPSADMIRQMFVEPEPQQPAATPQPTATPTPTPEPTPVPTPGPTSGLVDPSSDPTFENETDTANSAGSLGAWKVFDAPDTASIGTQASSGLSGSRAAQLTGTVGNASKTPAIYRTFSLGTLTNVQVTANVRLLNGTGNTRVAVAWYNGTQYLKQVESTYADNAVSDWQQLSVTTAAPAGATRFDVHLKSSNNTGTSYFDNVFVMSPTLATPTPAPTPEPTATPAPTPAPTPTPVPTPAAPKPLNPFADPGFEYEDATATSGSLGAWNVSDAAHTQAIGSVSGEGINGTRAGYLQGTTATVSKTPALFQGYPVGTLARVQVNGSVRLVNGTGSTRISIAWFANGIYLGAQNESASALNSSSDWQTLSVTAAPPAGATKFEVHLKSGNNSGTAYFDNVVVTG